MYYTVIAMVVVPMIFIMYMAFFSKRYVRDMSDYLVSGRVAGRYIISVGDMTAALSVINLVAACEANYQCGMAMNFWNGIMIPLSIIISLSGYCVYRFRQTKCLSAGQFFELRYSRKFRIVASSIRALAEMLTNAIGPAVAVRFFIYFLDIPHALNIFGFSIPVYAILVFVLLTLALLIILPAGRISLLVTDSIQGIISYPIFVVFVVFVVVNISWFGDVEPVMLNRATGESFINPFDISELRDFNMFALIVNIIALFLNRAAWIGNDTSGAGRNPHEQKMASILGTWRNGFAMIMLILISIFVITFMLGSRFSEDAYNVRLKLVNKVAQEVISDKAVRQEIKNNISKIAPENHIAEKDEPYSRNNNPDITFLQVVQKTIEQSSLPNKEISFVKFRSLYFQMMMPVTLHNVFPEILIGLFALLMIMLLVSTDNSRIFNASSTIIQDIILPFKKEHIDTNLHLKYLKLCSLGVTIFFFVVSLFFAQLDYINMFMTIMCGIWLGASGPIMVGGLYTRFGTTTGAWCALIFGSGNSILGIFLQRNWSDIIYPWLAKNNLVAPVGSFLEMVSSPFEPIIVWNMDPLKFPINSIEIYFFSMLFGALAYIVGSYLTYKKPYNLDKLLHRGIYSEETIVPKNSISFNTIFSKLIGITEEYSKGDKVIAWSVFIYSVGYSFIIMFVGVLLWNSIEPWSSKHWSVYFFISTVAVPLVVGTASTIWFFIGGIIDLRSLFKDLAKRVANPLDDGSVHKGVSLSDIERFKEIDEKIKE